MLGMKIGGLFLEREYINFPGFFVLILWIEKDPDI